jgi:hypothetical protein
MGPSSFPRSLIVQALADVPECELDNLIRLCPVGMASDLSRGWPAEQDGDRASHPVGWRIVSSSDDET